MHMPSILPASPPSRLPKSCLSQPTRPPLTLGEQDLFPWGLDKQSHVLPSRGNFPANTAAATAFTKSTFVPKSVCC